jgi:ElaB/YqjD/DUF883 family membrane-anchored ribosome-binding protein
MARGSHARRSSRDEASLREEIEQIGAQIVRQGERSLGEGQKKLGKEIARLKAGIDDLLERVGDRGRMTVDTVVDAVQQRPITSIAGAFAAGMLMSILISRK